MVISRRQAAEANHAPHVRVDRSDGRHHGSSRGGQTPQGGGETRDPLACFESLVDESGGECRGSRTPNTIARPRIWLSKVTRWPASFLRAMISERIAWAGNDFTSTGLKKPMRAGCTRPRASLRSVL